MEHFNHESVSESLDESGFSSPSSLLQMVSLPRVTLHLTRACHLPQTEYPQLCNLLQYDPALLVRYLFTLQAAQAGRDQDSISQRLASGDKTLLSRTLLCSARFDDLFVPAFWPGAEQFLQQSWLESLQCAFLTRAFARIMELPDSNELFFAGLLYRCGELALLAQEKQDYLKLLDQCPSVEERLRQERAHYHTDHRNVSQQILKQLGLPHAFRDAALYHAMPSTTLKAAHPVTRIVHVAHQIVSGQAENYSAVVKLMHQVLGLSIQHGEVLVESALNQSQDVQESLLLYVEQDRVRQRLLPALPPQEKTASLRSDLEQLRLERAQVKNILSAVALLDQAEDMDSLQHGIQRTAYLLFGCRHVLLFRYHPDQNMLQGENAYRQDAFENQLRLPLDQPCLPTECFKKQQAIHNFSNDYTPKAVVELELSQLTGCQSLVGLPLSREQRRWGCMVLAFEPDIQNRFNILHKALLFFSQQIQQALEQRDERMHWQQELAQLERKLFEHRLKRIAHEVNNPLSIAQNHLHILLMNDALPQELQDHVDTAVEQIESGSRILHNSIDRIEGATGTVVATNANELIQDIVYIFTSQNHAEVEFKTQLDESLPTIYIDENYLRQVLINLVKNALECCEEGDTIHIATQARVNINGRRHILIQVQDDGPGIPESQLDSLFHSQTSQKGENHGGIGLAIVKDLVEEMGGLISFQGGADEQSTFSIYLPVQ